jgi:hypothetical protein
MESAEIFEIFCARRCQVCGGGKRNGAAFCTWCYRELTRALQSSLWKRFGSGFEEAYHACLSWFREHPRPTRKNGEQPKLFEEKA